MDGVKHCILDCLRDEPVQDIFYHDAIVIPQREPVKCQHSFGIVVLQVLHLPCKRQRILLMH